MFVVSVLEAAFILIVVNACCAVRFVKMPFVLFGIFTNVYLVINYTFELR